jgi:hypothetical protein
MVLPDEGSVPRNLSRLEHQWSLNGIPPRTNRTSQNTASISWTRGRCLMVVLVWTSRHPGAANTP